MLAPKSGGYYMMKDATNRFSDSNAPQFARLQSIKGFLPGGKLPAVRGRLKSCPGRHLSASVDLDAQSGLASVTLTSARGAIAVCCIGP
jgi:hypothetical protein